MLGIVVVLALIAVAAWLVFGRRVAPPEIATLVTTIAPSDSPTPTATPTLTATPMSTVTPTSTATPTPTSTPTVTPGEILRGVPPDAEQLQRIFDSIRAGKAENRPETAHVAPPAPRIDTLAVSLQRLAEEGFEGFPLRNETCCDIFNRARATTYSLPGPGALFQIISVVEREGRIDAALADYGEWSGQALVIGGLLVYQDILVDGSPLPPGNYLVLLVNRDAELTVVLVDENMEAPVQTRWRLRQLPVPVGEAFSFITRDEICFSQLTYQACLPWRMAELTGDIGQIAVESRQHLIDGGWLLAGSDDMDPRTSVASIESPVRTVDCASNLAETPEGLFEPCQPDVIAYATEHVTLVEPPAIPPDSATRPSGMARTVRQSSGGIRAWYAGVGGLEVLQPLEGTVLDGDGARAVLEPDSYRVDLLMTDFSPNGLIQLIPAAASDEGPFFYVEAVPLEGVGRLVDGEEYSGGNDVILDPIWYRPCLEQLTVTTISCTPEKFRRPVCLNWSGVGWCDVIEPEAE